MASGNVVSVSSAGFEGVLYASAFVGGNAAQSSPQRLTPR